MGDVLICLPVLGLLKQSFPGVQIGFLVGSWALPVVTGNKDITWIHVVDHWKLNRRPLSKLKKFRRYFLTRGTALKDLRSVGYDVAVDLYPYFPNSALLLWQASIPARIGYTSAGFGDLFTIPLDFVYDRGLVVQHHFDLVKRIPGTSQDIVAVSADVLGEIHAPRGLEGSRYLVIHPGTGALEREWPVDSWLELVELLSQDGLHIAFTGYGSREVELINVMAAGRKNVSNLCGVLEWQDFVAVVSNAVLLVGVNSVAVRIAAAAKRPYVLIWTGIDSLELWGPGAGDAATVLMHPMPCAPCHRTHGCMTMDCIRSVTSVQVYRAIQVAMSREPSLA